MNKSSMCAYENTNIGIDDERESKESMQSVYFE